MLSYMAITGDSAEKNTPAKQETEGQCLGQEDPLKKEIAMGYSRATAGAAIQEFKYNSNTRIFPLVFEGTSAHTYTVTSMCLFKKLQTSVLVSGNVFTTDRPYFVLIKIWQNTV